MRLGPYELGYNDTPECGIYHGDARELAKAIPDESVDLIFTDPVYENIDDYRWLAETAARVLKPDSACLVFCAIGLIPETHDAMRAGGMSYKWRLVVRPVNSKEFYGKLLITSQECLYYEKGKSKIYESVFDVQMSTRKGDYNYSGSNWGKGTVLYRYVLSFSKPDHIVFDPFSGSGSIASACKQLGRNYLSFETNSESAYMSRERVRNTQPPLFVPEPEQLGF